MSSEAKNINGAEPELGGVPDPLGYAPAIGGLSKVDRLRLQLKELVFDENLNPSTPEELLAPGVVEALVLQQRVPYGIYVASETGAWVTFIPPHGVTLETEKRYMFGIVWYKVNGEWVTGTDIDLTSSQFEEFNKRREGILEVMGLKMNWRQRQMAKAKGAVEEMKETLRALWEL